MLGNETDINRMKKTASNIQKNACESIDRKCVNIYSLKFYLKNK